MTETIEHVAVNGKDMRLESQASGWKIWFFAPHYIYIELDGDNLTGPLSDRFVIRTKPNTDRICRRVEIRATVSCPDLAEILTRINPLDLAPNCNQTDWGRKTIFEAYADMLEGSAEKTFSFDFKGCPTDGKKDERVASSETWAQEHVRPKAIDEARALAFRKLKGLVMRLNSDYLSRLQVCMHEDNWDWSGSPAITELIQKQAGLEAELRVIRATKQQAMRQYADQWTETALIPKVMQTTLQGYLQHNGFSQSPLSQVRHSL